MTGQPDDDWSLLARAGRDPQALEALFHRHRDTVFRHALARCGSSDLADDITQEVFLRLAAFRRPVFRRARFSTWLYRVTGNVAIDLWRKDKRTSTLGDVLPEQSITDSSEQQIQLERVLSVMRSLPERQRQAFELRILEQWSTEETAAAMKISTGAVKTHLHRALAAVRKQLEASP